MLIVNLDISADFGAYVQAKSFHLLIGSRHAQWIH